MEAAPYIFRHSGLDPESILYEIADWAHVARAARPCNRDQVRNDMAFVGANYVRPRATKSRPYGGLFWFL